MIDKNLDIPSKILLVELSDDQVFIHHSDGISIIDNCPQTIETLSSNLSLVRINVRVWINAYDITHISQSDSLLTNSAGEVFQISASRLSSVINKVRSIGLAL